jgi:diaminopimelate decarboxylase
VLTTLSLPEFIKVNQRGHLQVEDCDVVELAEEFGTPLYVTSENQLRYNYRRFYQAFASRYPRVDVFYALKANNNLAVRRIMFQEGAGGECFGMSEMYATYLGGAEPGRVVINGSNKSRDEIKQAVLAGARIQVDAVDEVDMVDSVSRELGRDVQVKLRMKPELTALMNVPTESNPKVSIAQRLLDGKWGLDVDTCSELVKAIVATPHLKLEGFNLHFSRAGTAQLEHFALMVEGVMDFAAAVRTRTGYVADIINFGGGFAHGFNPEGNNQPYPPIEDYAETMVAALRKACANLDYPLPLMEFEPGRYLVGNATILVGRVGAVKVLPGRKTWVHVDASTNNLIKAVSAGYKYMFMCVNRAAEPAAGPVDVVGPLCSDDVMGRQVMLPAVKRGDLVAAFDAGHYAETGSCQFNGIPRPATVLVNGGMADIIKQRETVNDVFGHHRIPVRLLGSKR